MSMICVIPARDTAAILSAFQIPPPTAIRSVTHVISIPTLRPMTRTARPAEIFSGNSPARLPAGIARGDTNTQSAARCSCIPTPALHSTASSPPSRARVASTLRTSAARTFWQNSTRLFSSLQLSTLLLISIILVRSWVIRWGDRIAANFCRLEAQTGCGKAICD
jgi:hypothetical protein